ncbi:hypothetical protein CDO73_03515 [Saccharibacillus sp. O23]|uniref:DinB family protein n=1 Tax=Saccharibacillus sp. O23 TaxID=2009338 RepID=UPI000B4E7D3F|nr:DinB family protein [Saccharibacillus sp. O23]OWR32680.1 hypothetical protein CDO73_03515 [Saccharibacillus sp. O23]
MANQDLSHRILTALWKSCLDQEEWFPPLEHALKDVTAEQAAWKPSEGPANSIHQTVRHLIFYKKRLLMEARGEKESDDYPEVENNTATFGIDDLSEAGWEASRTELYRLHRELGALLESSDEEALLRPSEKGGDTLSEDFRMLAMHDAYHIGQIVQLAKMQQAWPAVRRFD